MSKRHSLNISIGPKPLQLLDASPVQTPLSASVKQARRQSSIAYFTSDSPYDIKRESTYSLPALATSAAKADDIRSSTPILKERPPSSLTLVEKHADLLQFIAQKESKCLELRSQLAMHETELAQLKKKWERIVSRGLERERPLERTEVIAPWSPDSSMIGGFREVSKFISHGLAGPAPHTHVSPLPSSTIKPRRTRPTTPSTSSLSTFTDTSSPIVSSRSSVSSADIDEPREYFEEPQGHATFNIAEDEEERNLNSQVLMVHDTGASPLVSPNPDFVQHKKERNRRNAEEAASPPSSFSRFGESQRGTLRSRQRSQDISTTPTSSSYSPSTLGSPLQDLPALTRSSSVAHTPISPPPTEEELRRRKRLHRASLPPVSPVPGVALGGLVSAIVGKTWEDTISKRASWLLSDVSQSISQALSPSPITSSVTVPGTRPTPARAGKARTSPPPTASSSAFCVPSPKGVGRNPAGGS